MTDDTPAPGPAPNLAVLKGITFGLGLLLLLGMVLIAVKMATMSDGDDRPAAGLAAAPLPPLPPGTVVGMETVDGALFVAVEGQEGTRLYRWSPQDAAGFEAFPAAGAP